MALKEYENLKYDFELTENELNESRYYDEMIAPYEYAGGEKEE